MKYQCPHCGSTDVRVTCLVTLRLEDSNLDGNLFPILDDFDQVNGAYWDEESEMMCNECETFGKASAFH